MAREPWPRPESPCGTITTATAPDRDQRRQHCSSGSARQRTGNTRPEQDATVISHEECSVRVIARNPPPSHRDFGVLFGMQSGSIVDNPQPATRTTVFDAEFELVLSADGEVDFRGTLVHGRRGSRFLYLCWGHPDQSEPFSCSHEPRSSSTTSRPTSSKRRLTPAPS